ncbi:MAG: 3-dehydroquinate synthase [Flavobacteriales bacterium AspAUS03]
MEVLGTNSPMIRFGENAYKVLDNYLLDCCELSRIFILVDEHTKVCCLPHLLLNVGSLVQARLIEITAREEYKNISTCIQIWKALEVAGADRKSLLINLGGGVITDMGGFAASVFKRGIRFIHIPTTLLGMVDASIGGKTGIDLDGLKNEIGLFRQPELLIIDSYYLNTLPVREMCSGMAELIKHGLIADADLWMAMKDVIAHPPENWQELIRRSVFIKDEIVQRDFTEKGLRKILNFGHTVGHAIETYFMNSDTPLLHGEAIVLGMICEAWLSYQLNGLPEDQYKEIATTLSRHYPMREISISDLKQLLEIMRHDKKNQHGQIRFSLLKFIGECSYNYELEDDWIEESLYQLKNFLTPDDSVRIF